MTCIKFSILYLYYRIFYVSHKFIYCLIGVAVFVVGYGIAQGVGAIFQCMPIDANWTVNKPHYCTNLGLAATIFAICNVLSDFMILILPMPLLFRLQKPMNQKIQIMGMFALGGL